MKTTVILCQIQIFEEKKNSRNGTFIRHLRVLYFRRSKLHCHFKKRSVFQKNLDKTLLFVLRAGRVQLVNVSTQPFFWYFEKLERIPRSRAAVQYLRVAIYPSMSGFIFEHSDIWFLKFGPSFDLSLFCSGWCSSKSIFISDNHHTYAKGVVFTCIEQH